MSVARVRALTHTHIVPPFLNFIVEMSVARVRASQRIISEKQQNSQQKE